MDRTTLADALCNISNVPNILMIMKVKVVNESEGTFLGANVVHLCQNHWKGKGEGERLCKEEDGKVVMGS